MIRTVRADLFARLQARRQEIEQLTLTKVFAISDPTGRATLEYKDGLRAAVTAAIDYSLDALEHGEERAPPLPAALLAQARAAAQNGISLETVLRRYFAGYSLLSDYLIEEAEAGNLLGSSAVKMVMRTQAMVFDHLVAAVSKEHAREVQRHRRTSVQRRGERIERLLTGGLPDGSEFDYDFDAYHLGAVIVGEGAKEALRGLAKTLDRQLLMTARGETTTWAWFGAGQPVEYRDVEQHVVSAWPAQLSLAIGEPAKGLAGWRLTHRQASAALAIIIRSSRSIVRYADVAILAAALHDDLLKTSLRELYLAPLVGERDHGKVTQETLRAYFAVDRNVSSAAALLGVNRRTVTNRLRAIERRLGRSLRTATIDLEVALHLQDLSEQSTNSMRVPQAT